MTEDARSPAIGRLGVNRSAVVVGHRPAFYSWLQSTGVAAAVIEERRQIAERTVYLIPACHYPEEIDEVVDDLFEEICRRECGSWQPDESTWPDTGDVAVFYTWFIVEGIAMVDDVGRGVIEEERLDAE